MSIRVMTSVWDDLRTQAHSELLVLLALADWANDDGYCWPTISALATKARLSERAVQQILGRLTATGRIRRIQGGGRGRANRYQVVTARNGASETVNTIHRKENTESETPNEIHPFGPERVNLTTENGECACTPYVIYHVKIIATTTTNGDVASPGGENGSSSSLVEDLAVDLWTEQKSVRYGGWVRAVAWPGIRASQGADSSIQASSQLGRSAFGCAP